MLTSWLFQLCVIDLTFPGCWLLIELHSFTIIDLDEVRWTFSVCFRPCKWGILLIFILKTLPRCVGFVSQKSPALSAVYASQWKSVLKVINYHWDESVGSGRIHLHFICKILYKSVSKPDRVSYGQLWLTCRQRYWLICPSLLDWHSTDTLLCYI